MEKELSLSLPISLSQLAGFLFFVALSVLSFFVPFVAGHPQWLVGIIVNTFLFLSAIFLPNKYIIPLALFPSMGVLARGLLFGPLTFFIIYFIPFIWLGNLMLVLVFKSSLNKIRFIPAVVLASAIKCLFLFTAANVYFGLHIVPKLFLQTMGLFQLYTSLAGGIIAFIIFRAYGRINSRSQGIS